MHGFTKFDVLSVKIAKTSSSSPIIRTCMTLKLVQAKPKCFQIHVAAFISTCTHAVTLFHGYVCLGNTLGVVELALPPT